ncbi:hypothetical protein [Stakelama saccharophila]|uniref:Lipoprotein n=1 Tax=Stakelama saccharophila TaxID=3075605 RepID=A0ABZ0B6W6_9SPHN|nr:hypothetical protein [Stakelama sp. W311]WNO53167.1 hypothetical protein RPR59_12030 [Stakelama sp. W311]
MKKTIAAGLMMATCLSACASTYRITPIAAAGQKVRYEQGVPTTDKIRSNGSVKVTPVKVADNGRLVFAVAALNTSDRPSNFGVQNISVTDAAGGSIHVYDHDELVREAKNRATWAAVAAALAGAGAAVAANQNAYRTTNATMTAPGGRIYTYRARNYDPTAAAVGTAAAAAGTTAAMIGIRDALDKTLAGLHGQILQTTTIDPNTAWGGKVVADKLPGKGWPREVAVKIDWNGERFPFRFRVEKEK